MPFRFAILEVASPDGTKLLSKKLDVMEIYGKDLKHLAAQAGHVQFRQVCLIYEDAEVTDDVLLNDLLPEDDDELNPTMRFLFTATAVAPEDLPCTIELNGERLRIYESFEENVEIWYNRHYTMSNIPAELIGARLHYGPCFLPVPGTFVLEINSPCTVYACFTGWRKGLCWKTEGMAEALEKAGWSVLDAGKMRWGKRDSEAMPEVLYRSFDRGGHYVVLPQNTIANTAMCVVSVSGARPSSRDNPEVLAGTVMLNDESLAHVRMEEGTQVWRDRHYTMTAVPSVLQGTTLYRGPHRLPIPGSIVVELSRACTVYAVFTKGPGRDSGVGTRSGMAQALKDEGWSILDAGSMRWPEWICNDDRVPELLYKSFLPPKRGISTSVFPVNRGNNTSMCVFISEP